MLKFIRNNKTKLSLFSGFILSIFSIGQFNIPLFIFIYPFLYLYYLHHEENKKKSIILICLAILISSLIKHNGFSNKNIWYDLFVGILECPSPMIPYIIEGILFNKENKWKSIFLFPLSQVSTEFIFSCMPLVSNFNIYAYALSDNLFLVQILSIFGIFGLSFIVALFSSLINFIIEYYNKTKKIHKTLYYYLIFLFIIYLFGAFRLLLPNENNAKFKAVSVYGISQRDFPNKYFKPMNTYLDYIELTTKKAKNIDADIIIFSELAFYIKEKDYNEMVESTCEIAKKNNIYILLSLNVNREKEHLNTNVIISDKGEKLYKYIKNNPVPIIEEGYKRGGGDELKLIETKMGKLTTVICYDMDFPMFINYIGSKHPDILLVPSWDWKAIAEFQFRKAKLKAIENGFNLIKNTCYGIVFSCDYKGRVLNYYNAVDQKDFFIVSDVYVKGKKTIYSSLGKYINYLYIIGLIAMIFSKEINQIMKKKKE